LIGQKNFETVRFFQQLIMSFALNVICE